jgi:thiosulfate/3-mercaptopyruvate sulfurtransferase
MSSYACADVLVETQWLVEHLADEDLRIIEADFSPEECKDAHIPGAVFWSWLGDICKPDMSLNLDPDAMAQLLRRSGIAENTMVVAYGSNPAASGLIFWMLSLFGHQRVKVLNGGYQKWITEGCPVTKEFAKVTSTRYPVKSLSHNLRVFQKEVEQALGDDRYILLDVRSQEEYDGKLFMMQPPVDGEQAGHIPGAIHLPFEQMLNGDGTFKSVDELQALLGHHGITADKIVFPYCAEGGRSGFIWFVLKYLLGYPEVRNYDGSWLEWSRRTTD